MKCILHSGQIIKCSKIHFTQNETMYVETEEKVMKFNTKLLVEVVE